MVRRRAMLVAIVSVTIMCGARYASAVAEDYNSQDLANYEATNYGVDLPEWYGDVPFFLVWTRGDGQAFVTLAADPLVQGPARELGGSLYRFGRVGYSVLARALVGWRLDLIPVGLFLANALGIGTLGFVAGLKSGDWGLRSLLLPLNPAVYVSITGDTAEVVGLAAITVAMVSGGRLATGIAGVVLGSSRPSYLTAAFISRRGFRLVAVALATAVALQVFGYVFLDLEWAGSAGNLTVPPMGYVRAWAEQPTVARVVAVGVAATAVLTLFSALTESGRRRLAFVASGLLVLSLEAVVVGGPRNILRAAGALPLLWVVGRQGSVSQTDGSGKGDNRPL